MLTGKVRWYHQRALKITLHRFSLVISQFWVTKYSKSFPHLRDSPGERFSLHRPKKCHFITLLYSIQVTFMKYQLCANMCTKADEDRHSLSPPF